MSGNRGKFLKLWKTPENSGILGTSLERCRYQPEVLSAEAA
jgi:hypothetical protein